MASFHLPDLLLTSYASCFSGGEGGEKITSRCKLDTETTGKLAEWKASTHRFRAGSSYGKESTLFTTTEGKYLLRATATCPLARLLLIDRTGQFFSGPTPGPTVNANPSPDEHVASPLHLTPPIYRRLWNHVCRTITMPVPSALPKIDCIPPTSSRAQGMEINGEHILEIVYSQLGWVPLATSDRSSPVLCYLYHRMAACPQAGCMQSTITPQRPP